MSDSPTPLVKKPSILKKPKFGEGFNEGIRDLTGSHDLEREIQEAESESSDDDDENEDRGFRGVKFRSSRSLASIKIMSERQGRIYDDWADVGFFLRYWDIGFSQSNTLMNLKTRLQDVKSPLNRPGVVVRYLVSERFNVNRAEKRFRDMIEWRLQCEALQKGYKPPDELLEKFPAAVLKRSDKEGDPIFVSRLGITDLEGLTTTHGPEAMKNYEIFRRESAMYGPWQKNWSIKEGRPFRDILVIEDLHELSNKGINKAIASIFGASELDQTYYPEVAKQIIMIRASKQFRAAWALKKRSIPKELRDKIKVFGTSDYLQRLEEYVDLVDLPRCIYPIGKGEPEEGMSPSLKGPN